MGLSIAELNRHYKAERSSNNKEASNYEVYARLFSTGFFAPRKDKCHLCESYINAKNEEKKSLEINYTIHQEERILSRNEKTKDTNRQRKKDTI